MKFQSLRSRLIVIILIPLLLIAVSTGAWQFRNATERAADIFDRGLLSAALAISRDIALSGGDALSPATRSLVGDTSGGELFYHVYAPDGVFVTGYSTPPIPPSEATPVQAEPFYYDARYQDSDVRVLRFQDATTVDGISGIFNITVWQKSAVRSNFVREVVTRSFAVIALLVLSVACVVWFGVRLGLRPLSDLEDAIALRTPTDLHPIQRSVPVEAQGLVSTLNALLDRVSRRISSKDEFISNAAHQLRNPVAGVLALAEAVQNAPDHAATKERSIELLEAARATSRLTNQLLSFERAKGTDSGRPSATLDFEDLIKSAIARFTERTEGSDIELSFHCYMRDTTVLGDDVMLQESVLNLLDNAVVHGGKSLSKIEITLEENGQNLILKVADDGIGIKPDNQVQAMARFGQAVAGPGSGLGLPIAAKIIERHSGALTIKSPAVGTLIEVRLPVVRKK